MARAPRQASSTGLYHVVLKGLNGMALFEEPSDYERFLALLASALARTEVALLSWCLMTNHVHLAVLDSSQSLSKMVHYVAFQYAAFFNRKHGRTGPLYNGRFWSGPISDEAHLLQVVKYIHLNPQRANLASVRDYRWSSYADYIEGTGISDTSIVMGCLESVERFELFMGAEEGLSPVRSRGERLSDWHAMALIVREDGLFHNDGTLKNCDAASCEKAITWARERGVKAKQLQRLTGLCAQVVQEARSRKKAVACSNQIATAAGEHVHALTSSADSAVKGKNLPMCLISHDGKWQGRKRNGRRIRH
ncbi:MAG: transposase [Coriobacteriales bacterium]